MAVQDCDKISNIVAIQLLAGNDDLAKEIAELAATKNYAQTTIAKLGGEGKDLAGRSINSLELMAKSAEIKIDAIVQSYILKGQAGEEALMEVARQVGNTKDSLYGGVKLLEMIRGGSDVDIKEVARLWDDTLDTSTAMKQMEDTIADYVASDYSIYRAYSAIDDTLSSTSKKIKETKQSTKDAKVKLDRGIITDKEFRKIKKENDLTIKTLTKEKDDIKEALKKDYKLAIDKIKEGGNPTGFSKLDSEWAAIKKVFGNDTAKASKIRTNYIMARELIAGGEMADEVLSVLAKEGENLTGDLTEEWIVKCTNLDTLIARAFTNTEQLCNNGMLRELYRDKLIQLSAGTRLTEENANKVKTLINTSLFAEEGMTLSDVVLDNRVYRSMKNLGYKVTERDGEKILNDLQRVAKTFSEDIFGDEDIVIKIAGQEMKPQDVVQLIYNVTGDENIIKLLNSKNFSDTSILSIATQKLLGNNELAREGIINLFKKGKEGNKIINSRGVFFRALTGMEVPDGAKVGYFDYRKALYTKDELSDGKARLYDMIANKNKLRVEGDIAGDFTKDWQYSQENVERLSNEIKANLKGGFLVVNDARWGDNQLLREAVDKLRKEGDLTILYPKGGQTSSFVWEGDNLFFKTIDDGLYDDIAGTISIQSLGAAKPTREILASAYEAATGRNGDKLRYQPSYRDGGVDNLGRQVSDQQVEYGFVTDDNGNIRTFYHWTPYKFDEFDISHFRKGSGDSWVRGFYFATQSDEKIIMNPDEANRLIEVYLKADNVVSASDKLSEYMTRGELESFIREFNPGVFDEFAGNYVPGKIDKIWRNGDGTISDLFYSFNSSNWGALFPDGQAATDFFRAKLGIDGIWDNNNVLIVFSPEQIKYVDNRLPTADPNMHFMRRDIDAIPEDTLTDDQFEVIRNFIIEQRDRFSTRGYEELIRNIMYTDPNSFQRTIRFIISNKKKYAAQAYDLFTMVEREREIWQAIILNNKSGKILTEPFTKDASIVYDTIDRIYKELKEIVGRRKKTALAKMVDDEKFKELKGLEGAQLDTVLGRITDNGLSPIELGIVVDDNGKILSIGHGGTSAISDHEKLPSGTFYHSHPENGWFSGGAGNSWGDLNTFLKNMDKYPNVGLINPGGLIVEFKNTPSFSKYSDVRFNELVQAINGVGKNYDSRIGTVRTALVVSLMTGEFDKQKWGIYADIINDYVDDVRKIVNKYMDSNSPMYNVLSPEDEAALKNIGAKMRERVGELDMNNLISGIYSDDGGLGEMYKNSSRVDVFQRALTNGQARYGFATADDVLQLDDSLKLGEYAGTDIARAYYVGGDDMGYVVDFRPFKGHQAMYIKFNPDNIVRSDDEFFRLVEEDTIKDYLDTHLIGYHYSKGLADVFQNKNATIKEVMDEAGLHYHGAEFFKELMLDVGIEGYYDATAKQLKLFDLGAVKDANNMYPKETSSRYYMRRIGQYSDQADMPITDALKVQMFTKDRTAQQIADGYGFPMKILNDTDLIEGVKAWGAWGNGMLQFTDMVKESTVPHELFHAIFNTYVGKEQYDRVLEDAMKLFQVNAYDAEEILADSFADWFKTGNFTYGDKLKAITGKKRLTKEQKTFLQRVKDFFEDLAETLGLVDRHRAEVEQMFNDMVNMKYLPDDGKPINPETALVKYNKELNDAAVNYFGKMLGLDATDPLYARNVETKLADMLGISLDIFDNFTDKASLYRRIDKQLGLELLTTGKFDREIVDIVNVRKEISGLSEDDLEKQIKDELGVLVEGGTIKGNQDIVLIREAWFNYNTAEDMSQLLSAEGKIISLIKGTQPASLSLEDLKKLFKDREELKKRYKEMFFAEQEVDDKVLDKFVKQINGDVYDSLSIQFVENLVKEGYDLPLINAKTAMYDYLNGKLDLNSDFARAFMYKNNIAMTSDNLNAIIEGALPREFSFDFTTFENKLADESLQGNISRVIKRENQFLPDTYTALSAIEGARAGENLGGAEYQVLKGTIDKYVKAMKEGVKNSNFTFRDAQKLKQEFSYAMDTFEQEIILPKYSKFLTPEERQSLLGIKYSAPIAVGGQNAREVEKMLDNWANRILGREEVGPNGERIIHKGSYQNTMSQLASDNDINVAIAKGYDAGSLDDAMIKRIERRRDQLISNGSTIKEVNGEYVVYDVKETLRQTLNNMPSSIEGYAGILALGREGIESLTNKQAYVLLRYLEATKALATTSNYTTQLMYKQTPLLAQYSFFTTYAVDANTGLPRVMGNNSLASDNFFTDILSSNTIDQDIKKDVFADIIKGFKKNGYIEEDELGKMIDRAIDRQIDELGKLDIFSPQEKETAKGKMKNIYTNMFIPYSYLRDLPVEGGIREKLESTIKEAYNQAIKDLQAAGASDTDDIQKMIMIRMDDGSSKNLSDLANVKIDDWKKTIFNDESILVRGADEVNVDEKFNWRFWEDDDDVERRLTKEQKRLRENIQTQYSATLQAIENQSQIISDAERELMVSFMSDVRTDLRKYSLTNKMVDALDAVSGMGEEVSRGMKNYIIGLRGMWTYGKFRTADIWARYDKVREAYKSFYDMPLESLMKAKPRNAAEEVAWNAARYFKNLERMLGSVDGTTGVTTSAEINKAFYHIGETFMNLGANGNGETGGIRGLFGMLSGIEQNQILKFFKFSTPNQASYVEVFKQTHRRDERLLEGVGGYRDYVENINKITREQFNSLFGTNYSDGVFKRVLQGLSGFTLAGGGFARRINKLLDVANSSWLAFRMMMSYPGQLLTIPQQGVAYFLKQIGYEQTLGIEDMGRIDAIRESFGVLDGAYNELSITRKLGFNPDSLDKNAFYNRYGIPTTKDLYEETGITTTDDYINMYAKVDKKYSKPGKISSWIKWLDPYKDNANNFIDGIFARNFKNIAFVKGLRDNSYMKFASAEDFLEFMNDATVSAEVKSRLMDAVAASSGRNFRNILGLGFGGLDRPIGGAGWQNILYGLMQLFNFRGSWGQNIFKQTGENFWRMYKATLGMPGLSREAREKLVDYLGNTPEFVNFVTALLHDLEWSFKLERYQDNGRWPDENEDPRYYFLDYLSYIRETMNMVSQWYQGIQSFGPIRPFHEGISSVLESQMDPTIYHDTWGVGAFFNALGKNFGRQRKPINWFVELAGAGQSGGPENMRAYIERQFFNLSFGSLRYMVNEDENSYGYTYEVSGQVGGIPSIAMGEAQIGSDKSFMYALDNSETWKTIQLIADDDVAWADKKQYRGNLWKAFVNGSQLFKTGKNLIKIKNGKYNKSFFSSEDLAGIIQQTRAGKEFYDKGYVTPSTNKEAVIFIKTILNHSEYRPGSKQFNKSLLQFEDFGHMDAAKGNAGDAQMELWLEHMKYKTNEHGEFVKKNGERVVDENWNKLITNIKQYYSNEEYVTNVIYNYSKDWLDEHSSDPNYPLYLKMLGQGNAHMLIESELNKRKAIHNKGVKGDLKWTDANLDAAEYRDMIMEMGNSILDGDNITFFEKLNRLDEDDATLAALKIIRDQAIDLGRLDIERFFNVETSKEDDTIVEDVTLKSQYESVLKQIGQIGRAIDEGNVDRVIAIMSSLTHQFKNDDPTGEVTAMVINSTFDRINEAKNLSPTMKNEMMIGLFYDNKDFIQRSPDKLRELLGDAYDEYARKMNEMLYKWDGQIISNMEELITRNEGATEAISKAVKEGSGASRALKSAATNFSGISGSGVGNGKRTTGQRAGQGYGEWVPVKIKGADLVKELGLKGYNPTNVNEIVFKHTPTVDLSLAKDINRKVKTTKSQEVSSKKQLSKLEEKATKAIEAES